MDWRERWSFTGVTGRVEKVKAEGFNCVQSIIAICTN